MFLHPRGLRPGGSREEGRGRGQEDEEASEPEPGEYQVLLSPTVASNLVETVGFGRVGVLG